MYNLKKVIASICVIAMMLTTVAFGATYSDVAEDSAYYEAVETLNKLEIVTGYEDGTYKAEAGVTRAEMAALIARIQGFGETAAVQAPTSFTDVPASHWASGYVASAAGMGIINGYGNGTFGPEDPVLYEQAVKMVMATLGYTVYAENNGGYPGGFIAAAQRYDVTDGVSNAVNGTQATRGTIAQLLANAIDTPLMAQEKWSTSGDVEYAIYDGKDGRAYKTLMSENLGYIKLRGVVVETATAVFDEAQEINTEDDAVVVIDVKDNFDTADKDFQFKTVEGVTTYEGEDTFLVGETNIADFFGQSVVIYVKKVDTEYEVVSVAVDTARNDVLEIALNQYVTSDAESLSYYKTATAKTATKVKVEEGAEVVYNNEGTTDTLAAVLGGIDNVALFGGKITLVDNDEVKGYDVIFVEVAETAVVEEVEDEWVAFYTTTAINDFDGIEVDADDETVIVKIVKDGAEIAYTDLAEWDILSIIAAEAGNYTLVEVITNSIVGTVTSSYNSTTSYGGKGFKIGDAKYDVAAGNYEASDLAVGDGGTFYIDKYGKIAAFNEDAALASGVSANYAYVTAAVAEEDELTEKVTATIQMVTAEGVVALQVATTGFKLDGTTNPFAGMDLEDVNAAVDELENTIIMYTKNSSNVIKTITTLEADDDNLQGEAIGADYVYDADKARLNAVEGVDKVDVDSDAVVFFIAPEATDSVVGTVADLDDEETYPVIGAYYNKKAEDNNILVLQAIGGTVSAKSSLAVVTEIGTTENADAETVYQISYLLDGAEVTATTDSDLVIAGLAVEGEGEEEEVVGELTVGDIIKVKTNAAGEITALTVVFDFADGVRAFDETFTFYSDYEDGTDEDVVGGVVTAYNKNKGLATIDGVEVKLADADNKYVIDANSRILEVAKGGSYKYFEKLFTAENVSIEINGEVEENTIAAGDAIAAYTDYVFVRLYDEDVVDVVIVKGPADMKVGNPIVVED